MNASRMMIGTFLALAAMAQAGQQTALTEDFTGALGGATGSTWGNPKFWVGDPATTTWYKQHYDVRVDKSQGDCLSVNYADAGGFRPLRCVWNDGDDFVRLGTEVGEKLTFGFDFTNMVADGNSQWANGANAIRFGVYNNGGTNPSNAGGGNYSDGLTDDYGFWGCFNRYDSNTGAGATTTAGGLLCYTPAGTGVLGGGSGVGLSVLINDTNTHTVQLVLERTAADTIACTVFLDGSELNSFAVTFAGDFDANQVAFWSAITDSDTKKITYDNISVVHTPTPRRKTTVIMLR